MLKLGFATLALLSTSLNADAAQFRWWGHMEIYQATGTCTDYNPVGTRGYAFFRPELAGTDNGPGSKLTLHQDLWTKGYRISTGLFTSSFKAADTIYVGDNWGPDDTATAQVRFITQTPATILTKTVFISITGQIKNYDYMPGCVVTFRAQLSPKS